MLRCLFLLIFALAIFAQEIPPAYDFVVIVDNSISMAERKAAAVSDVRDLIRVGFAQQAESEDRIHLWTCDLETPGDTLQEWDPAEKDEIAAKAADYLQATKFHRGTRLNKVFGQLAELLPHTLGLIAVVLTDGEESLEGIPFDVEINRQLAMLRRAASKIKRPVIIALSAKDGKWVDWKASTGIARPRLPRLPARPKTVAEAEKEPAPVAPEPQLIAPPPPEPALSFLYPPGAKIVSATPPAPEVAEKTPEPVAIPDESPKVSIEEPVAIMTEEVKTNSEPVVATNIVARPVVQTLVQLNLPPPVNSVSTAAPAKITNSPPAAPKTGISPTTPFLPYALASAGGVSLMLTAMALSKRGKIPQRSLISRSLGR
jgi:hypothetical protein